MNFKTAVKHSFKTALQFNTRASRSEYWNFALFTVLVTFAATVLDKMLFNTPVPAETGIISSISALILFIPGLSLMIKRLHDLDR
ncbi:MAG: yhaH, partial [Alphaproteobacteria bacterium]|nr:yhaH [Alphaproteobacteria bacterium]